MGTIIVRLYNAVLAGHWLTDLQMCVRNLRKFERSLVGPGACYSKTTMFRLDHRVAVIRENRSINGLISGTAQLRNRMI